MNIDYLPRLAEKTLARKLESSGCVLVTGPKFCGKSTLCSKYAKSKVFLNNTNSIELARSDPKSALDGETPHLIDEWQKAPEIWNEIKNDLDNKYLFGKYILTGSTTPPNPEKIQHSGAGRISFLSLKPFSLFESRDSTGLVSLTDLFMQNDKFKFIYKEDNNVSLKDIAYLVCRGGWPISVRSNKKSALDVTLNYYDGLFAFENESDEFSSFLKNRDIDLLQTILKCFARNISTQAKKTTMISDIISSGIRKSLDEDTFNIYLKVLKDLFLVFDMPAWNLNLRTSVSVRQAPTHHFVDTSIATACLGIEPNDLLNDLKSFGFFFEDFVVRDLSIYSDYIGAKLKHYRDSSGQEIDAIVELRNGEYGAIEIKISSEKNIAEGIKSLNSFEEMLIRNNLKLPKFKIVITSHGACYKKDNVFIVPINFLKQ